MQRVDLFHGNLVLDCPVPPRLLSALPNKNDREFTHMRYSAATCDPADFQHEQFTLRQMLYREPRETEMFIVITLYNEDEVLFARTLHGVMTNIADLCSRKHSKLWGPGAWKKVVVCVVADGRTKYAPAISLTSGSTVALWPCWPPWGSIKMALPRTPSMGSPWPLISSNIRLKLVSILPYTFGGALETSANESGSDKGVMPCQMLFCLKEHNQKKINSHRWFFQAFGPILRPNVCVLLDGGTRPGGDSLYHLWKAFDLNPNVAGACGEIVAMKGTLGKNLLNPLVAAQNFEYKMSNILDKPLESVFGFISVLPGAFSAYRYVALQNDHLGRGPLASYFKGEALHGADAGIFEANMYLAEDRILCFELVAKRKASWVLHYVKSAYAETDVPESLAELISQRRRWLNGSFFAAVYAISHAFAVFRTDHSIRRKFLFQIEFLYQTISMIFSWFALVTLIPSHSDRRRISF